ncbi:MAG: hypothetical protein IT437_12525 [Phycisphaerales bacterium]|nr:hypothetical protein [Phycisphaerales bacterium]
MSRMSGKSRSGTSSGDKVKLLLAFGLLIIAALVLAWYYEVLPGFGPAKPPPPTPEVTRQTEESQQIQQKEALRKDVTTAGS